MVEEVLVTLSDSQQKSGWKLLEKLDEQGMQVEAAFWRYYPEREQWELYLASPLVETQGGIKTARDIRTALAAMPEEERKDLTLDDVAPVLPTFPPVLELRRRYGTVNGERGQRVRRMSITAAEPFIYRL